MKKGRHRRFEEARALKRSRDVDLNDLFEDISDSEQGEHKPEHDAWADLAEEWDSKGDEGEELAEPAEDSYANSEGQAEAIEDDESE